MHALFFIRDNEAFTNQQKYQRRIKSLIYAIINIRLNITYAIKKLSQCYQSSLVRHYVVLNQVLYYIKKIADLILIYNNIINPICNTDVVYKNNPIDRKLTYNYTLLIKNKVVI